MWQALAAEGGPHYPAQTSRQSSVGDLHEATPPKDIYFGLFENRLYPEDQ
jgi:hypothetical protein